MKSTMKIPHYKIIGMCLVQIYKYKQNKHELEYTISEFCDILYKDNKNFSHHDFRQYILDRIK